MSLQRPLTEPIEFRFETDSRAENLPKRSSVPADIQIKKFKARPLNKKMFESNGDIGLTFKKPKPPTEPEEFVFVSDSRKRQLSNPPEEEPVPKKKKKKAPVSKSGMTLPEEFSLITEQRGEMYKQKWETQREEEEKKRKEARNFKATPLYESIPFKPKKSDKSKTEIDEFNLRVEKRGEVYQEQFQNHLLELEKKRKEDSKFKALPLFETEVFKPEKSSKALTEVSDFTLNSDSRAVKRKVFDEKMTEKERIAQEARRLREIEEKKNEEREIKLLRKRLVHKPAPVLIGKPIEIQRGTHPPTIPTTPDFHTTKRVNLRANRDI